jgi:guanylate kinase
MSSSARRGRLFVVSAPSGAGKTTVVERVIQLMPDLRMSRSYTSRPARPGETDGVDYHFVSRDRFEAMIAGDQFLEWADVFGNFYGTSTVDTERALAAGIDLVLVIDVQGARQVRRHRPSVASVFVLPPSFEVLESRLRGRSKDSEEQIRRRLETARREVVAVPEYDYVVVNDEIDACVERLRAVIVAERAKPDAMGGEVASILASFGVSDGGRLKG